MSCKCCNFFIQKIKITCFPQHADFLQICTSFSCQYFSSVFFIIDSYLNSCKNQEKSNEPIPWKPDLELLWTVLSPLGLF